MKRFTTAACALLLAMPAMAHPGHGPESGFMAGLLHPLTGIDHLLALLAVGLWSRQLRQGMVLGLTFLIIMALGAASSAGVTLPALELSIAASVLLLGVVAACAPDLHKRVPPQLAVIVVALCAFVHGLAHGNELAGMASGAGFLLSSSLLMLAGAATVAGLRRVGGAVIGAAGVWLVALAA